MNEWMMNGECKCECPKYNGKINEGTCLCLFKKGSSVIKAIRFIISHINVIDLGNRERFKQYCSGSCTSKKVLLSKLFIWIF